MFRVYGFAERARVILLLKFESWEHLHLRKLRPLVVLRSCRLGSGLLNLAQVEVAWNRVLPDAVYPGPAAAFRKIGNRSFTDSWRSLKLERSASAAHKSE